jgi:hypothetical protein
MVALLHGFHCSYIETRRLVLPCPRAKWASFRSLSCGNVQSARLPIGKNDHRLAIWRETEAFDCPWVVEIVSKREPELKVDKWKFLPDVRLHSNLRAGLWHKRLWKFRSFCQRSSNVCLWRCGGIFE